MLAQLVKQLDVLEGICVGPYVAGPQVTAADSALMPTFVFLTFILPRYFGWRDVFAGRPKLAAWWGRMQQDTASKRVRTGRRVCSNRAHHDHRVCQQPNKNNVHSKLCAWMCACLCR